MVGAAVVVRDRDLAARTRLPSFRHYILSVDGIFFWQRVLFGLAGPAVLSYLTWETAKIRSTQSATGILYVDFFTVVVGEVLAKYIAPRDPRAGVVQWTVCGLHRGPEPVQFQPANRVRAGRQQR